MINGDQPYLHDVVSTVRAPSIALSARDGQIRAGGVSGLYFSDRRIVDELTLRIDGSEPTPVAAGIGAVDEAWFVAIARRLGDPYVDPTVIVERRRVVLSDGMREKVWLRNRSSEAVRTTVSLECGGDLAAMEVVKSGGRAAPLAAVRSAAGLRWSDAVTQVNVSADPPPEGFDEPGALTWRVSLAAGESWLVVITIGCSQLQPVLFGSPELVTPAWSTPSVRAGDHRLARLVDRGLTDLEGLLLVDPLEPRDRFIAAGTPWFLTLFGRDSLWAARFLLPTGTELAASTLRTLARRQGGIVDAARSEEPGKILHEVRRADLGSDIPFTPVYYGSVDATPLWICLLCDAWRWGLASDQVAALIPNLERALMWMRDYGAAGNDGFLEYRPQAGRGLSNQGWKDSHDSVQWLDGRLAESPIALCEVQGYAYEAATKAADLLEHFGRPGSDEWRAWAVRLARRFREAFWVERRGESYPAIALDRHEGRVDTASSNIGHLLGTGILDAGECDLVARRLSRPDLDSGWGLRTMTSGSPRYNPLSYHGGSVWPHDTAIAILGLAETGHDSVASSLAAGLVAAAESFEFRLPELYGGYPADGGIGPVPYPAACRPQAWSAAAGVAVLTALLGVRPDVPEGRIEIAPMLSQPFGTLDVGGLVVAGRQLRVGHDATGTKVTGGPPGVRIDLRDAPSARTTGSR